MQLKLTKKRQHGQRGSKAIKGFTLIEALIATGVMALFATAGLTGIVFDMVAVRRAKEEAIAVDFLTHYIENLKAIPFPYVIQGQPINPLFSGATVNGVTEPNICIPTNSSPIMLTNADYLTFHPDLWCISDRNPQLAMQFDQTTTNGVIHDIHMSVTMTWSAPLQKGGVMQVQMDVYRTKDL